MLENIQIQKPQETKVARAFHRIKDPLVECTKKLGRSAVLATVLTAGAILFPLSARAQDSWANARFGFSPNQSYATATLEGSTAFTNTLKFYGFTELDATKDKPLDLGESAFVKLRLTQSLGANTSIIGEFLGATGAQGRGRFGVAFTPSLGKDNFTLLAIFPADTNKEKGPQVFLFTSQQLTDKIYAQLLADYASKPGTVYIEPELDIQIIKHVAAMLQGRISISPSGTNNGIVLGLKVSP